MSCMRNVFSVLISTLAVISAVSAEERSTTTPPEEHSTFQTLNACPSHSVRAASEANWTKYAVVRLMPSEYQPGNANHPISLEQAQRIRTALDRDLAKAFRGQGQGTGATVDIKPVITNVKKSNPVMNLLSFAVINTAISYGRASVRFELVDDATGVVIGEIVNRGNARPWNIYPWQILSDFQPLAHSYIMLNRDAKTLRKDLHRIQAKMPSHPDPLKVSTGY